MISSSVPITMSPAEAEVCADASDVMLAAVGRADATWTAAGVRAGRWWNALLAERVRERARRRYRKVMDTAARRYADAVGDLPARVRAEIVRAERDLRQRQSDRAEELRRRSEARRRVLGGGE
jgi:hypothetical protein